MTLIILVRPFAEGDPDRFRGKMTAISVRKALPGKTLDETLQDEVANKAQTGATEVFVKVVEEGVMVNPTLGHLRERFQPLDWTPPPQT